MGLPGIRPLAVLGAAVLLSGNATEVTMVTVEATKTASTVFRGARDEGRIAPDARAVRRLGELSERVTAADVQPLKRLVADVKADGQVTAEEADSILVEMEHIVHSREGCTVRWLAAADGTGAR